MEDKELLLKEIKGLIDDSQKEGVKKADLDKTLADLNERIAKLSKPEIDSLPETVNKLIAEQAKLTASVNAMNENANKQEAEKPVSFKQALINAVQESAKNVPSLLSEKSDDNGKRQSMKDYFLKLGNKQTPKMIVKQAIDMLETANGNYVNHIRLTDLDPKFVGIPLTIYPHVTDWMPTKGITKKYMSILVVYSYEDGAGTKTEGAAPNQSSFLFKTVEFPSVVIGTYFTLSDETLDDLPEAMEEISIVAPSKIKDNVDYQILGALGDDITTLKGLLAASKRTAFASATTYAGLIPGANLVDALLTMGMQGEVSKYPLDTIVMNPIDILKLGAVKDQLDNSISDRRIVYSTLGAPIALGGMVIRKNSNIPANAAVVLKNDMVQIGDRKQMQLEIGYNGTDFTEGQKTVRISVRLAFAVRDPLAVIYCADLAAAVTDITVI